MIQITIPQFDFIADRNSCNKIEKRGGLYIFYGTNKHANKILYIGKASELHGRVLGHYNGTTNVKRVCHNFGVVKGFYDDNKVFRDIYETYLINLYRPLFNREKVYTYCTDYYNDKWLTDEQMTAKAEMQKALDDVYFAIDL